jgi:hypothetical protein
MEIKLPIWDLVRSYINMKISYYLAGREKTPYKVVTYEDGSTSHSLLVPPPDPKPPMFLNTDYEDYQTWLAEGNTPEVFE